MKQKGGQLVISLDFELMWGMFDKVTTKSYGEQLSGVRTAIPRILKLFEERNVHATWATVGMLMTNDRNDLESLLPDSKPQYKRSELSAYNHLSQLTTIDTRHYFAPGLVKQIIKTPGQELASHTFSHYYCLEEQIGNGEDFAFAADCKAIQNVANRFNTKLSSIVFPRNQEPRSNASRSTLRESGITTYRGTENHFLYKARKEENQTNLFVRGLRLLDHYVNISGHHTYDTTAVNRGSEDDLKNVPASRFLRPFSKRLSFLEPMRLRRIKHSMTHAARHGETFHLWWHPHNFGANQEENFKNLTEILDHFAYLQKECGMQSKNMFEIAALTNTPR